MRRTLLLVAAGLALADASIVVLALPEIVVAFDSGVEGAAAVIGVYAFVVAVGLPIAAWLARRLGARWVGTFGLALFAGASLAGGLAQGVAVLMSARVGQGAGAAAALVAALALAGEDRRFGVVAVVGAAAGPAIGGALTQALDWRAIFLAQVPVLAAAAVACATMRPQAPAPAGSPFRGFEPPSPYPAPTPPAAPVLAPSLRAVPAGPAVALAAVSAALAGVLFGLVLLLVTGWLLEPLEAAAVVSVLPVAAVAGTAVRGEGRARAALGCGLVGAGVLAFAFIPDAEVAWLVAPQALAGIGMGLALPPLTALVGGGTTALVLRHAGLAGLLAVLAPILATRVDAAVATTQERGTALVLDAKLPPAEKVALAQALLADVDPVDPRGGLERALPPDTDATLRERADAMLVRAVDDAFAPAFLIAGALALVAALAAAPPPGRRLAVAIAVGLALALPAAHLLSRPEEPVVLRDPCRPRDLPSTGGLDGLLQDAALVALDRAACRFGSSREALALALVDDARAREYAAEHRVDPRSLGALARGVLGLDL